jgi:hypothetical protein
MASPFPGMDPWLERPMVFPDVHLSLVYLLKAAVNAGLPRGYTISTSNRVWVDIEARRELDVGVFGPDNVPEGQAAVTTMTAAGLVVIETDEDLSDPIEEPYLEIVSDEGDRLVTAIEVVSRANKTAGDHGRNSYTHKQTEYRLSNVNLVEIDLLRGGPHTTAVPESRLRAIGPYDYHVCIMLVGAPRQFLVAPIKLADKLPAIPIPLDPGVPPITVDLQRVFDRCYDEGGFDRIAKYDRKQPDPQLTPEQQTWAEGILRSKGVLP